MERTFVIPSMFKEVYEKVEVSVNVLNSALNASLELNWKESVKWFVVAESE